MDFFAEYPQLEPPPSRIASGSLSPASSLARSSPQVKRFARMLIGASPSVSAS